MGPLSTAHHGDEAHDYASVFSVIGIWCDAGGHPVVPQGDPNEYGTPESWLFSGEPECAPGDMLFGTDNPHGLGAVFFVPWADNTYGPTGFSYRDHRGERVVMQAVDDADLFAPITATIEQFEGDLTVEGCGTIAFVLPLEGNDHWLRALQVGWIYLEPARVDDGLDLCLGSTGTLLIDYASD